MRHGIKSLDGGIHAFRQTIDFIMLLIPQKLISLLSWSHLIFTTIEVQLILTWFFVLHEIDRATTFPSTSSFEYLWPHKPWRELLLFDIDRANSALYRVYLCAHKAHIKPITTMACKVSRFISGKKSITGQFQISNPIIICITIFENKYWCSGIVLAIPTIP